MGGRYISTKISVKHGALSLIALAFLSRMGTTNIAPILSDACRERVVPPVWSCVLVRSIPSDRSGGGGPASSDGRMTRAVMRPAPTI